MSLGQRLKPADAFHPALAVLDAPEDLRRRRCAFAALPALRAALVELTRSPADRDYMQPELHIVTLPATLSVDRGMSSARGKPRWRRSASNSTAESSVRVRELRERDLRFGLERAAPELHVHFELVLELLHGRERLG
jgi:hypothetical protein